MTLYEVKSTFMNNYPVGDFITRIKNAAFARKTEISIPYSRIKEEIAKVLVKEGYLSEVTRDKENNLLKVTLTYKEREPLVSGAKNISKPGVRIYAKSREIPTVPGGIGITIVSTPVGVMSDKQAKKKGLGGEVIAQIW